MDPALEQAITELVQIGVLEAGSGPADVTDLVVVHARGLSGIASFAALETLSLIACDLADWASLAALDRLRVLAIEYSALTAIDWVDALEVQVLGLRGNRLIEVRALADVGSLQSVDLRGNPLSSASYAWARDVLAGRVQVQLDDEETWELCRALQDEGWSAVAYRDARGLRVAWTGLRDSDAPEAGHPVVSPADVRSALRSADGLRALLPGRGPDA